MGSGEFDSVRRRQLLGAVASGSLAAVAGCGYLDGETTEMTLMIERVRPNEGDAATTVSLVELQHVCSHLRELEHTDIEASNDKDNPATASAHLPYTVALSGGNGYLSFSPREDGQFGFFVADGTVAIEAGTTHTEQNGDIDCGEIDRYAVVEPDDGPIVVELTSD